MLSVNLWQNPRVLSIVRHIFISDMLKCEKIHILNPWKIWYTVQELMQINKVNVKRNFITVLPFT